MDIKGEIGSNTDIEGDFNAPLTLMDRSFRQKIKKERVTLSDKLEQMDLINVFRAFYTKAEEYTFFSSACKTLFKIDHMLELKMSLNKFKKIEIISSIFYDYYAIKLEISCKSTEKHTKTWKLNNMLLNNEWVNDMIKEEIKI